ncbi:MAG: tetratricopeptide repeat protein [Pseudomonadota bacterium]
MRLLMKIIGFLLVCASFPSFGTQDDLRLDALFSELHNASSGSEAREIEKNIWEIWFEGPNEQVDQYFESAQIAASGGDYRSATTALDKLIDAHPEFAEGWNQRAIVYFVQGKYSAALADVDKTLSLEPRHFGAASGKAQCYLALGEPLAAIDAFEQALSINPWLEDVKEQLNQLKAIHLNPRNAI